MSASAYKVLFIGRDIEFQATISKAFTLYYDLQSVRSTNISIQLVQKYAYDVVIIDEAILASEEREGEEPASIKWIYKSSLLKNSKTIFMLIYEKNTPSAKTFEKLNETTLFFKKSLFTSSRLAYSLALLKRARYRSVIAREIQIDAVYPMTIFFMDTDDQNNKVFLEANKPIKSSVLEILKRKKMTHVYLNAQDFSKYITQINATLPANQILSVNLNLIRRKVKRLLTFLVDDSSVLDFLPGEGQYKLAQSIYSDLDILIDKFPDLKSAIEELPYPRTGLLNHSINTTIYIMIFTKIYYIEHREEVAIGALIHDIGLSLSDFEHVEINDERRKMSLTKKLHLEDHISSSIDIVTNKMQKLSHFSRSVILTHHELADGTGGPSGKTESHLLDYQMLLPLAEYVDELRTKKAGDTQNTFIDTFKTIIELEADQDRFGKLGNWFNKNILNQLDSYFNS